MGRDIILSDVFVGNSVIVMVFTLKKDIPPYNYRAYDGFLQFLCFFPFVSEDSFYESVGCKTIIK